MQDFRANEILAENIQQTKLLQQILDTMKAKPAPPPKVYGVWLEHNWWRRANGDIIASPYPHVLAAEHLTGEVREIGQDGNPVDGAVEVAQNGQ